MNAPGIRRRIAELFRPHAVDRESVEELRQHIELLAEDKRRAGLDDAEALRQARLEAGSAEAARDYLNDDRTGSLAEELRRDLGYAIRVLARAPGASALSVLTMAVGIGASAILFALVSGVVLRPLPHPKGCSSGSRRTIRSRLRLPLPY